MQVCSNIKRLYARLERVILRRGKAPPKRALEISAPFDFKHNNVDLPGLNEDELAIYREKAAASRIGVADHEDMTTPRQAPPIPIRTTSAGATSLKPTPSQPVSPLSPLDTNFQIRHHPSLPCRQQRRLR